MSFDKALRIVRGHFPRWTRNSVKSIPSTLEALGDYRGKDAYSDITKLYGQSGGNMNVYFPDSRSYILHFPRRNDFEHKFIDTHAEAEDPYALSYEFMSDGSPKIQLPEQNMTYTPGADVDRHGCRGNLSCIVTSLWNAYDGAVPMKSLRDDLSRIMRYRLGSPRNPLTEGTHIPALEHYLDYQGFDLIEGGPPSFVIPKVKIPGRFFVSGTFGSGDGAQHSWMQPPGLITDTDYHSGPMEAYRWPEYSTGIDHINFIAIPPHINAGPDVKAADFYLPWTQMSGDGAPPDYAPIKLKEVPHAITQERALQLGLHTE